MSAEPADVPATGPPDGGLSPDGMRAAVAKLLGLPPDRVADDDDLLALGMDSIQVMRLAGQWRRRGAQVGYAELIEHRTLAQWWELVRARCAVPDGSTLDGVGVPSVGEPFGLATMQQAYWVGRGDGQVLGGVGAAFYCEFDGSGVRADRLERAVAALADRHEMLRARFLDDGRQQILPRSAWHGLTVHDLTGLPAARAEREAGRIRDRMAQRRMAAEAGEVFDVALTLLPGGSTRVHLAVEMLVCDAQSFRLLLADLAALYARPHDPLPELTYSFRHYLADRQGRRAGGRRRDREYWLGRLPDLPGPPRLPLALPPSQLTGRSHVRRCHALSAEQWRRLAGQARRHAVLVSMTLAAAFADVLGAWSSTDRFLLNMPYYDRDEVHPDVPRIVGDFTDVVLVGVDLANDEPFPDRVRRLQERFHTDLAHGGYPGVEVMRDLVRGNPTAEPPAPVVFTTAANLGELFGEELRASLGEPGYTMSTTPQVWLDCQVTERDGGLFVNWDAVEELFPPGVLDAMFGSFVGLLERLVDGDWADAGVTLPEDQATVRRRVNATAGPVPDAALHDAFFHRAGRDPGRTAICWGEQGTMSYGELAGRAGALAGRLASAGIRRGDLVAVQVPRGPDQIVAVLGVLAAGAAYLPVGVDQPVARRDRVLAAAGVRCVVGGPDMAGGSVTVLAVPGECPAAAVEPVQVTGDDLAYVIYTSGSTGEPKGVEICHRSALNTVADIGERFGLGEDDRVLAVSALDFDLSVFDIFGPLSAGGAVVLIDEANRREAARWVRWVRHWRVTVWNSVPALLEMALVAGADRTGWGSSLRLALVSGDWVGLDLLDRLRGQGIGARLVALGGATEASIWSNAMAVDAIPPHWRSVPYGFPLRNQRFRVVDRHGRDCPDWVEGELWIGGVGVARGYRGDPERTGSRFVERDGCRWYRTGDLGRYWPDGTLEFLGRRDFQVKLGGHRVELGEIEAAAANCPGATGALAAVLSTGGGIGRLGMVVAAPRGGVTATTVQEFCRARLPGYMVPDTVSVVPALPLGANGKVDRAAATSLLMTPTGTDRPERGYAAPLGDREHAVARLWTQLLGVDRVGRHDGFFALGGDSLLATQLLTGLRAAGFEGGRLSNLFARPILRDFAATLRVARQPAPAAPFVADPGHRYDPFPPTEVQRAYWMGRARGFALGGVGSHWYWELDGRGVDLDRLERVWNRLVQRHEMLRAVFDDDGNQRVLPTVPRYRIAVTDVDQSAGDRALAELRDRLSHRIADPARWPLVELAAVRYGDRVRLAFSFDYLVLDALSIVLVFNELSVLYADPSATLPPVTMSFRDYVCSAAPGPEELATAQGYWLGRAATLPPAPLLPLARDPGSVDRPRFVRREAVLARAQWEALVARARTFGVTPAVVLATAYAEVLGRWSASRELTVNLTLFDRRPVHPGVDATVGDFTSLLLAAYRPSDDEDFTTAVRRFQEQIWADMEHRAVSAIEVLRERARRGGSAAMPVVFTSALGLPAEFVDLDLPFGTPVWGLSQTPQVWLDCQVAVRGGGLVVTWDAVEDLFPPGLVAEMFDGFQAVLRRLVAGDWNTPAAVLPGTPAALTAASRPSAPAEPAALSEPFEPAEAAPAAAGVDGYAAPVGPVEWALARLWARLLNVERVGRRDSFFALGGDSLLATQLVEDLRRELAVPMTLRLLLDAPTLADLADLVGTTSAVAGTPRPGDGPAGTDLGPDGALPARDAGLVFEEGVV